MRTRRIFLFGREVFRSETTEDADKSLGDALAELIEDDDVPEMEYYEPVRGAEESEHLVFTDDTEQDDPIYRANEDYD